MCLASLFWMELELLNPVSNPMLLLSGEHSPIALAVGVSALEAGTSEFCSSLNEAYQGLTMLC